MYVIKDQLKDATNLLCWPVLNPQITGVPGPWVSDTENVSVVQSLAAPPVKSVDGPDSFVTSTGPSIEKVFR